MTDHRLGELFAGYNGLGLAIEKVFNATPAWFSEWEAAPSRILAHRYPHVPNYGDVTKIDWANIEQATIISGGSPCQDLSLAGRRKGMTDGTRSNLWQAMCDGIEIQRPEWVVWENVRGALSATATSDLEHCPGCMGNPTDCALRALGRVLGDLADLGYDCQWRGLRAADVGAPHGRFRVFLLAHRRDAPRPTTADPRRQRRNQGDEPAERGTKSEDGASLANERRAHDPRSAGTAAVQNADVTTRSERRQPAPGQTETGRTRTDTSGRSRTPTTTGNGYVSNTTPWWATGNATTRDATLLSGHEKRNERPRESEGRQPTRETGRPNSAATDAMRGGSGRRATHPGQAGGNHAALGSDQGATTADHSSATRHRQEQQHIPAATGPTAEPRKLTGPIDWGPYGPAIRRWERVTGNPAPRPTEPTGRNDGHRLNPEFAEWMMGLQPGWIVDTPGITRNDKLKAAGNGVVPQQATAALQACLQGFRTQWDS